MTTYSTELDTNFKPHVNPEIKELRKRLEQAEARSKELEGAIMIALKDLSTSEGLLFNVLMKGDK